jgi:hypothetical protein
VLPLQRRVELGSLGRGEDRLDLRSELFPIGTARRRIDVAVRLARLRGQGGNPLPLRGAEVQCVNGVQEAAAVVVVVGGRRSAGRSGERSLLRAGRERGGEHGGERREGENAEVHHYGGDTYGGYLSS